MNDEASEDSNRSILESGTRSSRFRTQSSSPWATGLAEHIQ